MLPEGRALSPTGRRVRVSSSRERKEVSYFVVAKGELGQIPVIGSTRAVQPYRTSVLSVFCLSVLLPECRWAHAIRAPKSPGQMRLIGKAACGCHVRQRGLLLRA